MPIDVFCHVVPWGYRSTLESMAKTGIIAPFSDFFLGELRVPGISDLDERFSIMDRDPETKQVLSLSGPFLETIAGPEDGLELAKKANDEMARLVAGHPDRFAQVWQPCRSMTSNRRWGRLTGLCRTSG